MTMYPPPHVDYLPRTYTYIHISSSSYENVSPSSGGLLAPYHTHIYMYPPPHMTMYPPPQVDYTPAVRIGSGDYTLDFQRLTFTQMQVYFVGLFCSFRGSRLIIL